MVDVAHLGCCPLELGQGPVEESPRHGEAPYRVRVRARHLVEMSDDGADGGEFEERGGAGVRMPEGRARGERNHRRLVGCIVGAIVVLAGSGCGDDDTSLDDAETGGEAVTIEEWASGVELICADAREEVLDVAPPEAPDEYLPWLDVQVGILEEQADRVEALGVPEGYEEPVGTFLGNYRETVALAEEAIEFQQEGATPLAQERMTELVQTVEDNQAENEEVLEELGVEGCRTDPAMLERPSLEPTTTGVPPTP